MPSVMPETELTEEMITTAMAEADARGEVTPALRAAWRDPVVRAAHVYELGAVTVVLVLMLTKPF